LLIPCVFISFNAEQAGNPTLKSLHIDQTAKNKLFPGGNMEGKESRFGITTSALWMSATTATSNGSVNTMADSFTPIGGLMPLWLMHLGEVAFGGVGSGLYGILLLTIITIFIGGLMVGRTPEYLGKKISTYEMKMAALIVLIVPLLILVFSAIAVLMPWGKTSMGNPNEHGLTEVLYAFTSLANNNGSAFAGLNASTSIFCYLGGIVMLIGRFWIAIPILAIAGSLAEKKTSSISAGTLQTHSLFFIALLVCIIMLVGALSFFPVLTLGPIAEQLTLWSQYGS
jgi:K+-transporting ATPase ATPase A chain